MAGENENEDKSHRRIPLGIYPARLTALQAGKILGFGADDMPILVANKMLKPLGKPLPNATKYFAYVEIIELLENIKWLQKATQVIYDYWAGKNRRKTATKAMFASTENTALAA